MPRRSDGSGPSPLTAAEKSAIRTLEKLAETWPKSLWLFSASGGLHVMKVNSEGDHARHKGDAGGMDQAYIVSTILGIDNDGGDW